jgi:hypothetical protein
MQVKRATLVYLNLNKLLADQPEHGIFPWFYKVLKEHRDFPLKEHR